MSDDFAIYDAKEAIMAREIGRVIIRWARLESQFLFATAWALKQSNRQVAQLLNNFRTFSLTLDFVDTAVKNRLAADGIPNARWISLVEYVRELSGDRNQIVHAGVVAVVQSEHPQQHLWEAHNPMIGTGLNSIPGESARWRLMSIEDVAAIHDDVLHAYDEADAILIELGQP